MTRMILVGLAGFVVGASMQPTIAQSPVVPCTSAAWIEWMTAVGLTNYTPIDAFQTKETCDVSAAAHLIKIKSTAGEFYCFPETFNPRPHWWPTI